MAVGITIQESCIANSESANVEIIAYLTGPETFPFSWDFEIRDAVTNESVYQNTFIWTEMGSQSDTITLPNGSYNYYDNEEMLMGNFDIDCVVSPPCDLVINSVVVTPDKNSAGTGKITVNATSTYPIEYSKDNYTWQSSNILAGYTPGTYTVYTRDSNFCYVRKENVEVTNTACDLVITSLVKTDETAEDANNGTVTVTASDPAATFNIDGGLYQSSGTFTGLAPGVHTVYVKDAVNCTSFQNFTINAFDPPIVEPEECFNPELVLPEVLPYRFVKKHCNPVDDNDSLYNETQECAGYKPCYYQPVSCSDLLTLQIYYLDEEFSTVPKLSIIDDDTKEKLYTLAFTDIGSGYYKIEKNISELPEICEKRVYLEIVSYSSTFDTVYYTHARSEGIKVTNHLDCNLLLEYWNDSDYEDVLYEDTGYINNLRLEAICEEEELLQEIEVYVKSNGYRQQLSETISEVWRFEVNHAPFYLHKIIALALSHQHVRINGREYVKEEPYTAERIPNYSLRKGLGKLTAKNYQSKNLIE